MSIKLLDCTLRDGGYYNNWNFNIDLINEYLQAMSYAKIDYVELGFRSLKDNHYYGSTAYTNDKFINNLIIPKNIKVGVMINASELISKKNKPDEIIDKLFSNKKKSKLYFVRIAAHLYEYSKIEDSCKRLKILGYKVCLNIMQISEHSISDLYLLSKTISQHNVDVLYFADSLGSLDPKKVKEILTILKKYWKGALGIHTHDNMEKALVNSRASFENGVTWIDGTVFGMGRGPGNAKTEYLCIEFSKNRSKKTNLNYLNNLIDKYFKVLKNQYKWGTNYYYYLSGLYGIHPTYIQEMLNDARYSSDDIVSIIEQFKNKGGRKYDPYKLETARYFYKEPPKGSWSPKKIFNSKVVLILGSGPSVKHYKESIEQFILNEKPIVLGLNASQIISNKLINYRAACHPIRLLTDSLKHKKYKEPLITPYSMLPKEIVESLIGKKVYDYGLVVKSNKFVFKKEHCILPNPLVISYALAIIAAGNAKKIFLAGFDGYNYNDPRRKESEEIFQIYKINNKSIPIFSITPTTYDLASYSIYSQRN